MSEPLYKHASIEGLTMILDAVKALEFDEGGTSPALLASLKGLAMLALDALVAERRETEQLRAIMNRQVETMRDMGRALSVRRVRDHDSDHRLAELRRMGAIVERSFGRSRREGSEPEGAPDGYRGPLDATKGEP